MTPAFIPHFNQLEVIRDLIRVIGDEPDRDGLKETPERVIKSFEELFSGYKTDPSTLFKVFEKGSYDEIIVSRNIDFTSWCEHHLLPFSGVVHVGYLPLASIVGLSKLARVVDCFSKRLQVQERMTFEIANCLLKHLEPLGAGCIVVSKHTCQSCRGVKKPNAEMVTSCMQGYFREKPEVRDEFMRLALGC